MNIRWNLVVVGVVATVLGFLLSGNGPLGSMIWPPAPGPEPEGTNLALLMAMGAFEAISFGAGVVFLVAGYSWVKARTRSVGQAWLVYLSVAWMLVNWVPHTALHMNHGNILTPADFGGLVAIEYAFHLTLIVAGAALALFVLSVPNFKPQSEPSASPSAATTRRST